MQPLRVRLPWHWKKWLYTWRGDHDENEDQDGNNDDGDDDDDDGIKIKVSADYVSQKLGITFEVY